VWENHKHGLMRRHWKRGGSAGAPVPYSTVTNVTIDVDQFYHVIPKGHIGDSVAFKIHFESRWIPDRTVRE